MQKIVRCILQQLVEATCMCSELLLKNEANIRAKTKKNATAVMMAALYHQQNAIQLFSKQKECDLNHQDVSGYSIELFKMCMNRSLVIRTQRRSKC